MGFTNEEFDVMVNELLYQKPICYDMLCTIVTKTLKNKVSYWCSEDSRLCGRGFEDDIMQEIHIRLMRTVISYFLLKDGVNGPVNSDPDGFRSWIYTVADNLKRDFANKVQKQDGKTVDIDNVPADDMIWYDDPNDREYCDELREAFSIVISADAGIYKILTWLAQFTFVIYYDVTKIESNEMIVDLYEKRTLFEMYESILRLSECIPWIEITPHQNDVFIKALNRPYKDKGIFGELTYEEFFMMNNGKKSGKKSISDWVNRLNTLIQKKTGKKYDISKKKKPIE